MVTYALVQSLSIPVIGAIAEAYDASEATATWVLTAYLVSAAVATPMLGRVGDKRAAPQKLSTRLGTTQITAMTAIQKTALSHCTRVQSSCGGKMPAARIKPPTTTAARYWENAFSSIPILGVIRM